MSLIYNDYQKIKQENNDMLAKLSGKNTKRLLVMFKYISWHNVSMFETEVIRKDMIGIALEADARGQTIEESIGCSEIHFCDGIIKEGMKNNYMDYLLIMIRTFVYWLFVINTLGFVFIASCSNKWGITTMSLALTLMFSLNKGFLIRYYKKNSVYKSKKEKLKSLAIVVCIGWLVGEMISFLPFFNELIWFYGHGRIVWLVLLLSTIVVFLLNSAYWNRCSKQYDWK